MTPRLRNAIEQAYQAFGSRSLGETLEVCHCRLCMTEEMAQSILDTPLRELSRDQLSEYTYSHHAWSDQFPYLLPRYMELISQGSRPSSDPLQIFSRFRFAPTDCMTPAESATLVEWVVIVFEETLCSPIPNGELRRALDNQQPGWMGFGRDVCEIVNIALPIPFDNALLREMWEQSDNREANLRLACLIASGAGAWEFHDGQFSDRVRPARAQWLEWFTYADHREKLTRAFERETDPRAQELLLSAI